MNLNTEDERKRNEEVNQRLHDTAAETARQLNAATQELIDRHATETATAKVQYDHQVAELSDENGNLKAEHKQFTGDLGWFQTTAKPPKTSATLTMKVKTLIAATRLSRRRGSVGHRRRNHPPWWDTQGGRTYRTAGDGSGDIDDGSRKTL